MRIIEVPYGLPLYEATKTLRNEVLRKPIGLVLSERDLEGEETQIHIALLTPEDRVQGTVILKPLSNEMIQLRQMAVSPELQGKGFGRKLVQFAENTARSRHYTKMKVKARITVQEFYEKLGYETAGDVFKEVTLHTIMMYKKL